MNKITEPMIDQERTLTAEEAAYYDARTLQGLAEAKRGLGISVDEAIERAEERICDARRDRA